jgi:hypothetical protein
MGQVWMPTPLAQDSRISSLPVTDYTSVTGQFCSAVTGAIGIQLQNTEAITASNAGTVTIYLSKITITPP